VNAHRPYLPVKRSFLEGSPRLHYLEWNPAGTQPIVLLHGTSANVWWWEPFAALMPRRFHLLAIDQRGHGDSEWMRPPAYRPADYAADLARFIAERGLERPVVVGHSMGGVAVLAFAERYPSRARAAVAIDVAVTSTRGRDRFLRRLKSLPTVVYPDLATAKARFRLMPSEGAIAPAMLAEIAEKSLDRTEAGGYTLKFDRESFFGGDGIEVLDAIRATRTPLLLIRGELSKIMTAEGAQRALESNPRARLEVIAGAHHHVLLERPDLLAEMIQRFVASLET
jgi:pimeloyl-ACP methyl ester carboxylesterase